ncbi:hypothetical protein CPC16_010387 [Podila verticillata]|nr:hypothetical protein CPC16_010387 [Podila verticillata]
MAQVSHLEQFHQSQEAAKCFDDDLDFCPSLTAKELSEIILASILAQKELQAKQQQRHPSHLHSPPRSPPHNSRAITIVDPTSRTPLYIPPSSAKGNNHNNHSNSHNNKGMIGSGRYSTTTPTSGLMNTSNDYFNMMPTNSNANNSMGRAHNSNNNNNNNNNNQQLFNSMYGSHAYAFSPMEQNYNNHTYSMGMLSPTSVGSYSPPRQASRIPIVNPDNGRVVSVPEGPSSASWQQQHFVAVR